MLGSVIMRREKERRYHEGLERLNKTRDEYR